MIDEDLIQSNGSKAESTGIKSDINAEIQKTQFQLEQIKQTIDRIQRSKSHMFEGEEEGRAWTERGATTPNIDLAVTEVVVGQDSSE